MLTPGPLHAYLLGTASWFLAFGAQGVLFAWLVTIVLFESPERVGVAQMMLMLPGLLLMLVGGGLSDRYGGARMARLAHLGAMLGPLCLSVAVLLDAISYALLLIYALWMGTMTALVTPARDGLLNQVARGRIQRTVMLASMCQFLLQIAGYLLASLADRLGAVPILLIQSAVLITGAWGFSRISDTQGSHPTQSMLKAMAEGARTVLGAIPLRIIAVQNIAMGLCFAGSFIVTFPILVRDVFQGSSADLGVMNAINGLGLVLTILWLLRLGDIQRSGRALLISQALGASVLGAGAWCTSFLQFCLMVFVWGLCGGIAMTMSRTIMQEKAPDNQRGRVMALHSLTFMGAGAVGTLVQGYLVQAVGVRNALLLSGLTMLSVVIAISLFTRLWRLGHADDRLTS